ncbi:2-amino-4-hydroxy-6-hydroxymethyldihydropteridine diphosphokinase [Pelistega sp. MC2]|uniref:2-amino-4-hydroxy-6- hydroxymethyldihydropteridine diphosphokinase n=1 Tax=Pelistega sp. MC2 TaxID=1720297 RepID=UPI0008DB286B|nr:2-amino-4-hydroxy-6-hydroxymethyldihydropteridine diphosphokinase [Pelistega sp. MC2]
MTKTVNNAYIALGSNLGESSNYLGKALHDLSTTPDILSINCSSFYRSSPVDSHGPDYVNAVAQLSTTLSSQQLLALLQSVELKYGRERPYKNAPRTLDLDILLFNNEVSNTTTLTIPHPRMHLRAFVLVPLKEIAPEITLPQGAIDDLIGAAYANGQTLTKMP